MSDMVWTSKKPDRPGPYWMKNEGLALQVNISKRSPDELYVTAIGCDRSYPLVAYGTNVRWSSEPIPEPSEPPEHPDIQRLRADADFLVTVGECLTLQGAKTLHRKLHEIADKLQAALSEKESK